MKHAHFSWTLLLGGGVLLIILIGSGYHALTAAPPPRPDASFSSPSAPPSCESLDRNAYGLTPGIFSRLPNPPVCARSIINYFRTFATQEAPPMDESIYTQPEFYPGFETDGLPFWTDPPVGGWGFVGVGSYPNEKDVIMQPGETLTVRFYFRAGWGVRTYQGVALSTHTSGDESNPIAVEMDPRYREGILLEPAYPSFFPGWAHLVPLKITVPPTQKEGIVTVTVSTESPYPAVEGQWDLADKRYARATEYVGKLDVFHLRIHIQNE